MPRLSKPTYVHLRVASGPSEIIDRDLAVRSHIEIEIGIADALRQHRLATFDRDPLCNAQITLERIDEVRRVSVKD